MALLRQALQQQRALKADESDRWCIQGVDQTSYLDKSVTDQGIRQLDDKTLHKLNVTACSAVECTPLFGIRSHSLSGVRNYDN